MSGPRHLATLNWDRDCCRSSPAARGLGYAIRARLQAAEFPLHGPARCLQRLLHVPIGSRALAALTSQAALALEREYWISLSFSRPRREILLPNPLAGYVSRRSIDAFRALATPAGMARLRRELGDAFRHLDFGALCEAWEASLPGSQPPLLISIYSLRFSAATPTGIDLASSEIPRARQCRQRTAARHARLQQACRALLAWRIRHAIPQPSSHREPHGPGGMDDILKEIHSVIENAESTEERTALRALLADYGPRTTQRGPTRKIALTTVERQARAIDHVLRVRHGSYGPNPPYITPADIVADGFLRANLPADADLAELFGTRLRRTRSGPPRMPIVHPGIVHALFGLDRPPAPDAGIDQMALRILACILVHCARRLSCLHTITLGDIGVAHDPVCGDTATQILLTDNKSGQQVATPVDLEPLWPSEEIRLVHDLVDRTHHLPRATKLVVLAGCPDIPSHSPDVAAAVLRERLSRLADREIRATHIARSNWATWWPIRILAAKHPEILDLPRLQTLRSCSWFRPDALDRLRKSITPETDAVELARRIMGHGSHVQYVARYCRAWPLLVALRVYMADREHPPPWLMST